MFLNGISLDLFNLDTDLLELDHADTPEVVALQSSAPYVLHHTEQAFIFSQGTAQMFSLCCASSQCVLSLASLFYDSQVELPEPPGPGRAYHRTPS